MSKYFKVLLTEHCKKYAIITADNAEIAKIIVEDMIYDGDVIFDQDDLTTELDIVGVEELSTDQVVRNFVDKLDTKYKEGLTKEEVAETVAYFKGANFSKKKFRDAMTGNTGIVIEGEPLIYKHDVIKALICALEDRELTIPEWD